MIWYNLSCLSYIFAQCLSKPTYAVQYLVVFHGMSNDSIYDVYVIVKGLLACCFEIRLCSRITQSARLLGDGKQLS